MTSENPDHLISNVSDVTHKGLVLKATLDTGPVDRVLTTPYTDWAALSQVGRAAHRTPRIRPVLPTAALGLHLSTHVWLMTRLWGQ